MIARKVIKAFEAWHLELGRVMIQEPGIVLQDLRVVFDPDLGRGAPEIKRAVEFHRFGIPYYADFDRLHRGTEEAAPQTVSSRRGSRNA